MLLKKKQSAKAKTKACTESHHHRKFNHELESRSHIITACLHIGLYVINTLDYNYKLRNVIGREDDFTANKWKWFDSQVCDTFLWSWMISWSLVDCTDMGRIIGCILDNVYTPFVSIKDSIGSITSYFHTSMIIHPESNNNLRIRNQILGNMISSSSKKQRNGKVSLNNVTIEQDNTSAIQLERNGWKSSSKQTKHTNVQ